MWFQATYLEYYIFFPEQDNDNEHDKENPENIDESQMLDEGDDGEYLPEQMQDGKNNQE